MTRHNSRSRGGVRHTDTGNKLGTVLCMRVLSWNLWHDETNFMDRLERAIGLVSEMRCDVVLLQENRVWDDTGSARIMAEATGMHLTQGCFRDHGDIRSGLAVLTKSAPRGSIEVSLSERGSGDMLAVSLETGYGVSYFGSVHLTEGVALEHIREEETWNIEQHVAKSGHSYAVVGGTFATVPDADSVRFLTGRTSRNSAGAYWIDSWEYVGEREGYTIAPHNEYTERQKSMVGVDRPDLVPPRREDLILVRGYLYGEPGSPFNAGLVGTGSTNCSDHYGVVVDMV